jgi:hypothetical protein
MNTDYPPLEPYLNRTYPVGGLNVIRATKGARNP